MFFNTKTTILRSQFFRTSATYARLSLKFLSALPYFNKFLGPQCQKSAIIGQVLSKMLV